MSRGAPYDEAHDQDGSPRPQYAELLGSLGAPGELADEVKRRLRARGVSFGAAPDGTFALDPVPRILTEEEWSLLQAGIAQRLLALEAFLEDVYGEGRVFEAGVLSREDVEASVPSGEQGMTLAEIQEIAAQVGVAPRQIEDAALLVDARRAAVPRRKIGRAHV